MNLVEIPHVRVIFYVGVSNKQGLFIKKRKWTANKIETNLNSYKDRYLEITQKHLMLLRLKARW